LVCIQFPYSLFLTDSLPSAFLFRSYIKPFYFPAL
jgi:hypothetical protein